MKIQHRFSHYRLLVVSVAITVGVVFGQVGKVDAAAPESPQVADDSPQGRQGPEKTIAGSRLESCVEDLASEDRVERLIAIRTLAMFNEDAGAALIKALDHEDPAVKFLAATQLGRIGGDPLKQATEKLKAMAERGQLGGFQDDESEPETSDDPQLVSLQIGAAYALCEAGQTERYLSVLIDAIGYGERGVACYAADLIGRLGPSAKAATEVLTETHAKNRPGVKGGDYHLGGAAMNALRKIRDTDNRDSAEEGR